jgi:hypothetical protein
VIEYAHWTGNAILVRFQSLKQRGLVLTQAKQLPPDSTLSIREDYSKDVSARRKGLMGLYKQLRSNKQRATLRADRMYTDEGVFTYDLQRQEIIRLGPPTHRSQHNTSDGGGAGGPNNASATANVTRGNDINTNAEGMEGVSEHGVPASTGGGYNGPPASDHQLPPYNSSMQHAFNSSQPQHRGSQQHSSMQRAKLGQAPGEYQRRSRGAG